MTAGIFVLFCCFILRQGVAMQPKLALDSLCIQSRVVYSVPPASWVLGLQVCITMPDLRCLMCLFGAQTQPHTRSSGVIQHEKAGMAQAQLGIVKHRTRVPSKLVKGALAGPTPAMLSPRALTPTYIEMFLLPAVGLTALALCLPSCLLGTPLLQFYFSCCNKISQQRATQGRMGFISAYKTTLQPNILEKLTQELQTARYHICS